MAITFVPEYPMEVNKVYVVPNMSTATWLPPTSKTVKYRKTVDDKTQTVDIDVQPDGTVHVSEEAFDMIMKELGFERG